MADRPHSRPPGAVLPVLVVLLLVPPAAGNARAQAPAGAPPADSAVSAVLDTVLYVRHGLFSPAQRQGNPLLRVLGALHATTRPYVIRQEVLFAAGEPYDSALLAETERNLRARGLFRKVEVDTTRVEGRLAGRIRTVDAWSLLPRLELRVASDGTVTGVFGGTETNLAGTGNIVQALYVRDVERDGLVLGAGLPRLGGSGLGVGGTFAELSDRSSGAWSAGVPFRALSDRWSVVTSGSAFHGQVFQYRTRGPASRDTLRWHRRAAVERLDVAYAPRATPRGYVRVGWSAEVRREEFFPRAVFLDPEAPSVPDTVYGLLGVWGEVRSARFQTTSHFNGFTEEDQDLSRVAFVGLKLAPGGWGYGKTGIGPRLLLRAGDRIGGLLIKGRVDAQGLWSAAGLDSGRVSANVTAGFKAGRRHATLVFLAGGVQEDPPPGGEIDLGFRTPPRLWEPHAFIGTRSVALTAEHRWYAWDGVFDLFGIGFSAFLDYGGAWFEDQPARTGGNVGLSLLVGWPLRSSPIVTELSGGYRFGGGIGAAGIRRWAASLGTGITF